MANKSQADQTTTLTQERQQFEAIEVHLVPLKKIKILGDYAPEEIGDVYQLFHRLLNIHNSDGLIRNNEVRWVRLQNRGNALDLISETEFYGNIDKSLRGSALFYTDYISFLTSIAWILKKRGAENLSQFVQSEDPEQLLRIWGDEAGTGYVSEISLWENRHKVIKLLGAIAKAFKEVAPELTTDLLTDEDEGGASDESKTTLEKEDEQKRILRNAAIALSQASQQNTEAGEQQADQQGAQSQTDQSPTEFFKDHRQELQTLQAFLFNYGSKELLNQFLDESLLNSYLKDQREQTLTLLRQELYEYLLTLPQERLEQLFSVGLGTETDRLRLWLDFEQQLLRDGAFKNQLAANLRDYLEHLKEIKAFEEIEDFLEEIEADSSEIIDPETTKTWKQEFESIKKIQSLPDRNVESATQEKTQQKADSQADEKAGSTEQIQELSSITAVGVVLEQQLQLTNLSEVEKNAIRQGYNEIITDLFNQYFIQHSIEYSSVPKPLRNQLTLAETALRDEIVATIKKLQTNSLLSLTTEQGKSIFISEVRQSLRSSKNAATAISGFYSSYNNLLPAEKQKAFSESIEGFLTEKIVQNVDEQTASKIQNTRRYVSDYLSSRSKYELIDLHGIVEEQLDSNLKSSLEEIQKDLSSSALSFADLLSPAELELFATDQNERKRILTQYYAHLNRNNRFRSSVSKLYSSYKVFLEKSGRNNDRLLFEKSINQTLTRVGASYVLKDVEAATADQLFNLALQTHFSIDSPLVSENIRNTVDALLLSYGIDSTSSDPHDTAWFLRNLPAERLSLIFSLPDTVQLNSQQTAKIQRLLSDYATLRFHQLPEHVTGELLTYGIVGIDPSLVTTHTSDEEFKGKIAREVTPIREAIADGQTAEEIAKATNDDGKTKTKQELNKSVLNVFLKSWQNIPIQTQKEIYRFYGRPFPKQYDTDTVDPTINLPLPIEFLDFDQKAFENFLKRAKQKKIDLSKAREVEQLRSLTKINANREQIIAQISKDEIKRKELLIAYVQALEADHLQKIAQLYNMQAQEFVRAIENQNLITAALNEQERERIQQIEELRYSDMAAYSAALTDNPNAFDGQTYKDVNSRSLLGAYRGFNKRKKTIQSLRAFAQRRAGKAAAGKVAASAAGRLAGLASGIGTAATLAAAALQNKKIREAAIGIGSYALATTIQALSSVGGLTLAFVGGAVGGPLGFFAGAHVGNAIVPTQWTGWFGMNSRTPPSPVDFFNSSTETFSAENGNVSPMRPSLRELRGVEKSDLATGEQFNQEALRPSEADLASQSSATNSTNPATVNQFGRGTAFNTSGSALPATTAQLSTMGLWGSVGTLAPLSVMIFGMLVTYITTTMIMGAFLVSVPTSGSKGPGANPESQFSEYVSITKKATPSTIKNNTATQVSYTIAINPKANYSLEITNISDKFSYMGGTPLSLSSPQLNSSFPVSKFNDAKSTSYSVEISGKDVMVINTVTVIFNVYDISGNKVASNEKLSAVAAVTVGNPEIGCFVFGPAGERFPYGGGVEVSQAWTVPDQQMLIQGFTRHVGSNPSFVSLACSKGPITVYRLGSSNWYGWTLSANSIGFYSGTFGSDLAAELTFIHELGHIIDFRNAGLRSRFVSMLPGDLHGCYTYPSPTRCRTTGTGDIEVFAEGIMQYVLNYKSYNLKTKYPEEYAWFKTNIFGGVEYY